MLDKPLAREHAAHKSNHATSVVAAHTVNGRRNSRFNNSSSTPAIQKANV
jgi:hypothetical protein